MTANYPQVMGVGTFMGRWFARDDEPAAVIGYRAWQRWFHGDPHILGKRVRSETQWYTIVGVAPPEFAGIYLPLNMDIWVPFRMWAAQYGELGGQLEDRTRPRVFVFGRMKAGVATAQAAAELSAIDARIRREQPRPATANAANESLMVARVRGIPNSRSRRTSTPIAAVLMAVVGIVLLIACVNVGNLLLARGAGRAREISVRMALGARRGRIVRQLMTESLLLAAAGGLAGLVLGAWTARLLEVLLPTTAFGEALRLDLTPDARVMGLRAAAGVVHHDRVRPGAGMARQPRGCSGGDQGRCARRGAIPAAARLAGRAGRVIDVLLLTAGLFLRVLVTFQSADAGFAVKNRMYITVLASPPEFTPETARQFYAQTLDRLRAMPGVKSAAVTNLLPLTPVNPDCVSEPGRDAVPATASTIGAGYLETMRIPLMAGRDFGSADVPEGPVVAIVNESLARRMWPGQPAIGKRVWLGCHGANALQVVGVARDARVVSLGEVPGPHVYRDFAQDSGGMQNILVETAADGRVTPETLRKTVAAAAAGARIYGIHPFAEWVDRSYWQVRWEVSMLGAFGALALVLAAVGLYGVVAYHVTLRRREIGIRIAIGAQPAAVLRMVLSQGLSLTLAGVGIGLAACLMLDRALAPLLYGVSPADPPTYAAVTLVWVAVAGAACYWPARRAACVDPTVALRWE